MMGFMISLWAPLSPMGTIITSGKDGNSFGCNENDINENDQADVFLSADGIQGKSLICEQLK